MNSEIMQLFHVGSTFFMRLPGGKFFSVTSKGSTGIIEELPTDAKKIKEYPHIDIENMPPSGTLYLMRTVLMVAKHFTVKNSQTSSSEKGA